MEGSFATLDANLFDNLTANIEVKISTQCYYWLEHYFCTCAHQNLLCKSTRSCRAKTGHACNINGFTVYAVYGGAIGPCSPRHCAEPQWICILRTAGNEADLEGARRPGLACLLLLMFHEVYYILWMLKVSVFRKTLYCCLLGNWNQECPVTGNRIPAVHGREKR